MELIGLVYGTQKSIKNVDIDRPKKLLNEFSDNYPVGSNTPCVRIVVDGYWVNKAFEYFCSQYDKPRWKFGRLGCLIIN